MIFLNAEVISGLGEDTFWTWFKREFPNSAFAIPQVMAPNDVVLRYSTLGPLNVYPSKSIALLWELIPEMKEVFNSNIWDEKIDKINNAAKYSTYRVVATPLAKKYYEEFGSVDVIPIGVDTDLFKPLGDKIALRNKYNLPIDKKIGIWAGTTHPMKGFERLNKYAQENIDTYWIIVWKQHSEAGYLNGASNFIKISQQQLVELFNAADFYLSCGMLKPFYMIEWEAMACNLPMVILDGMKKDFVPSQNPRDDIFRLGWDRKSVKLTWEKYFYERGIQW